MQTCRHPSFHPVSIAASPALIANVRTPRLQIWHGLSLIDVIPTLSLYTNATLDKGELSSLLDLRSYNATELGAKLESENLRIFGYFCSCAASSAHVLNKVPGISLPASSQSIC